MASLEDAIHEAGDPLKLMHGGGSANPAVERHTQTTIRAAVAQRPFPKG